MRVCPSLHWEPVLMFLSACFPGKRGSLDSHFPFTVLLGEPCSALSSGLGTLQYSWGQQGLGVSKAFWPGMWL